jgi:hypothetical protein
MTDMANAMPKMDKGYQAECDLGTLIEAEKIKRDKPRFKAALAKRKERMAAMAAIDEEKGE